MIREKIFNEIIDNKSIRTREVRIFGLLIKKTSEELAEPKHSGLDFESSLPKMIRGAALCTDSKTNEELAEPEDSEESGLGFCYDEFKRQIREHYGRKVKI